MARAMKEDEDPLVRVKQYVESHNIKVTSVSLFSCLSICYILICLFFSIKDRIVRYLVSFFFFFFFFFF